MAEAIQRKLQVEIDKFQGNQKEMQKLVSTRKTLDGQLTENTLVKEELELLEEDAGVYKMIGPALIKQDLATAKQTVNKRIEYINSELKRYEVLITDLEKKQDSHRETLTKLQQQLQQLQVKAAAR